MLKSSRPIDLNATFHATVCKHSERGELQNADSSEDFDFTRLWSPSKAWANSGPKCRLRPWVLRNLLVPCMTRHGESKSAMFWFNSVFCLSPKSPEIPSKELFLSGLGIEPRAWYIPSKQSSVEQYPQPLTKMTFTVLLLWLKLPSNTQHSKEWPWTWNPPVSSHILGWQVYTITPHIYTRCWGWPQILHVG